MPYFKFRFVAVTLLSVMGFLHTQQSFARKPIPFVAEEKKQAIVSLPEKTDLKNLKNVVFPSEKSLLEEAHFRDLVAYSHSLDLAEGWVGKTLTQAQRTQLERTCSSLVTNANIKTIPLSEQTLACVPWWIERNHEAKQAALKEKNRLAKREPFKRLPTYLKYEWKSYKNMKFSEAYTQINADGFAQAHQYATSAHPYASDCNYRNANISVLLKLEEFLPETDALQDIESIYTAMQRCLLPNQEGSERVHYRVGFIYLLHGEIEKATMAFQKIRLASEVQENTRSLFWLGAIYQKENKTTPSDNPYWQQLIQANPISLSSIIAAQQMNLDPISFLVPDEEIQVQNRTAGGWHERNIETYLTEAFMAHNRIQAAEQWSAKIGKNCTDSNPRFLLYWSVLQNKLGNYNYSIFSLAQYLRTQKNPRFSMAMLKLQFPQPYLNEIMANNLKSNVDPILILSLIRQESAFDRTAHSHANARGLMQLLPSTARMIVKKLPHQELFNPKKNIQLGQTLLEHLFRKYNGKTEYVLAAYNAGEANLDRWLMRVRNMHEYNMVLFSDYIPYPETRNYISIILRNYYWYNRLLTLSPTASSKQILAKSVQSEWKPVNVDALVAHSLKKKLDTKQKTLLEKIYAFGETPEQKSLPGLTVVGTP